MADRAMGYLNQAWAIEDTIVVEQIVLAELIFVLSGPRLSWTRERQINAVRELLAAPFVIERRSTVIAALVLYESSRAHWVDCFLPARSVVARNVTVVTFDTDFRHLAGARVETP